MAYTEQEVIDNITILEDGKLQIRKATKVLKDGVEIAKSYHRHIVVPGEELTGQHSRVAAVARSIWTPEVIAEFRENERRRNEENARRAGVITPNA